MPNIARTTNGGTTWVPINIDTGVTGACKIKWVLGTPIVYIMGENGGIKRSIDNGLTWNSMTTCGVINLNHFDFIKIGTMIYGYAVSRDGYVIKLIDSVLKVTGTNHNNSNIPKEFKLGQNYPNPFNPTTIISFSLPKNESVSLKIFDALGREIETLVNDYLKAGKYNYSWNSARFASGVYFYKLTAGNDFIDTKKMILEK